MVMLKRASGEIRPVRAGDTLEGWTVATIRPGQIVLRPEAAAGAGPGAGAASQTPSLFSPPPAIAPASPGFGGAPGVTPSMMPGLIVPPQGFSPNGPPAQNSALTPPRPCPARGERLWGDGFGWLDRN